LQGSKVSTILYAEKKLFGTELEAALLTAQPSETHLVGGVYSERKAMTM